MMKNIDFYGIEFNGLFCRGDQLSAEKAMLGENVP
jgi:hypothetical protein